MLFAKEGPSPPLGSFLATGYRNLPMPPLDTEEENKAIGDLVALIHRQQNRNNVGQKIKLRPNAHLDMNKATNSSGWPNLAPPKRPTPYTSDDMCFMFLMVFFAHRFDKRRRPVSFVIFFLIGKGQYGATMCFGEGNDSIWRELFGENDVTRKYPVLRATGSLKMQTCTSTT